VSARIVAARARIVAAGGVLIVLMLWLTALSLVRPITVAAQQRVTVSDVVLSADTIAIGDRFDLSMTLTLPDDRLAFIPDSLIGPGFEPLGPVEWSTVEAAPQPAPATAGGSGSDTYRITVTWPLIAFDVGTVVVPGFDVFAALSEESETAGLATPGSAVGSWSDFREAPAAVPSALLLEVPGRQLWVASVLTLAEEVQTIAPRPPADVSGGDRNWPATFLIVLFGLTLTGVLTTSARDLAVRAGVGRQTQRGPRARALAALDALFADELHRSDRVQAFYGRSSEVVREYVEGFDPRWNRAWTSTELMRGLLESDGWEAASTATPGPASTSASARTLSDEIAGAEAVKFGGVRPDPDEAERYWHALRAWISSRPDDAVGPR
jgi:hypothetical protein